MRRPHKFKQYIKDGGYHAVYLISLWLDDAAISPIKIGISTDPQRRLVAIQAENPTTLELHASWWVAGYPIAVLVERNFKGTHRVHNIRGEWFDMEPKEAIEWISQEIMGMNTWSKTDIEMYAKMRKHKQDELERNYPKAIAKLARGSCFGTALRRKNVKLHLGSDF